MKIDRVDHLVLTVRNIENTVRFYSGVLGMQRVSFGENRVALLFGTQKINLHLAGHEFEPKADKPKPGSADLCFIVDGMLEDAIAELERNQVEIIEGPVSRTGATGPIHSVYIRDPDNNLIELAVYE